MLTGDGNGSTDGEGAVSTDTLYNADIDTLGQRLTLAEYTFDPSLGEVEGSVMNGTDRHFVNVQVEFLYFDLDGDSAGVVRDTTRELLAGETWRFAIPIISEEAVSRVVPGRVTGAERQLEGAGAESPRRMQQSGEGSADPAIDSY